MSDNQIDQIGVHASHCCLKHGCKYGDEDCPVTSGEVKQLYPCEYCSMEEEDQQMMDADYVKTKKENDKYKSLLIRLYNAIYVTHDQESDAYKELREMMKEGRN